MEHLFFEDPFWLYVGLGALELVLFWMWSGERGRRSARRLLYPPIAAAMIGALAALVTTDRERLVARIHEASGAAVAGRFEGWRRYLDDRFRVTGFLTLERAAALERAQVIASRYGLFSAEISDLEVEVESPKAQARFEAHLRFHRLRDGLPLFLRVDSRWRDDPGRGWVAVEARLRR
jgi:hypothetical protein